MSQRDPITANPSEKLTDWTIRVQRCSKDGPQKAFFGAVKVETSQFARSRAILLRWLKKAVTAYAEIVAEDPLDQNKIDDLRWVIEAYSSLRTGAPVDAVTERYGEPIYADHDVAKDEVVFPAFPESYSGDASEAYNDLFGDPALGTSSQKEPETHGSKEVPDLSPDEEPSDLKL
jgi:hypothetical protein